MADAHLSEEELSRFQDGERSARATGHLEWCGECKQRLHDLEASVAVYAEYRGRNLPPAPKPWRSLPKLHEESAPRRWWPVPLLAAAVCTLVAAVLIWRHPAERPLPQAEELLTRSAAIGKQADRRIAMRYRGRTLIRPAVLAEVNPVERDADLVRLAGLFEQARYNWRDPLSAGSFQSWRRNLAVRHDHVTVIDAGNPDQAYRVRTDTDAGVLRSASLTLRGADLHPVSGQFDFLGEAPLNVDESDAPLPGTSLQQPPAETPASPADTLHVLAALNQIGADVGEPIVVSEDDAHHVLVSATGLSAELRQKVAAALQGLPRVKLDLDAAPSAAPATHRPVAPERNSTGMPAAFRKEFEDTLGGPLALQEITDRVLEAAGSAVAVAHALDVLKGRFPPAVEAALSPPDRQLLHDLRQAYLTKARGLAGQIRGDLKPLLPVPEPPARKADLLSTVAAVDTSLNRLLAGSYSQAEGEATLRLLAQQLDQFDEVVK
jgi:hypothetical protein